MDRRVARRVDVAEIAAEIADADAAEDAEVEDDRADSADRGHSVDVTKPGRGVAERATSRRPDDDGDHELDQPVPNCDQLVAEAVTLAAAKVEADPQLCELVAHYWRLVPDEELIGRTPKDMIAAAISHRELAAQRL